MNTETQEVTGAVTTANALKMAINLLESLKTGKENFTQSNIHIVCSMCEEALAQPAQEPVAMYENGNVNWINTPKDNSPLYTHPAPSWQGLSEDDMAKLCDKYWDSENGHSIKDIISMVEQALKEKNANNN